MSGSAPEPPAADGAGLVFDDPLDRQNPDSADTGWGDDGRQDGDLERFLRERPPHHL